ncbi:HlyD family efflux transporter periplasmic adaptor subunit [Sphingobium yanoikuyae]|uniref:HlyD family efflux transporter periplasmic adaptor subunit n=1 Tax=Sphingobium yanoikuyae TaxID=13690 RepID=A0A6P1GHR5_SPHYA|nr:HlyD family efflux transporter periplasmic adaptor subunit [Sphingobium yanoikuyae]QHD67940.1 HlyD family efflux transporter periplasmic adaptor subunit [Sphingobium yanoikuyae]
MAARADSYSGQPLVVTSAGNWKGTLTVCGIALLATAIALMLDVPNTIQADAYIDAMSIEAPIKTIKSGQISSMRVRTGQRVRKGEVIAEIDHILTTPETGHDLERTIGAQRALYQRIENETQQKSQLQRDELRSQIEQIEAVIPTLSKKIALQDELISVLSSSLKRFEGLTERGFVTKTELERRRSELLQQQQNRLSISSELSDRKAELKQLSIKLDQAEVDSSISAAEISRQMSDLENREILGNYERHSKIISPSSGVVLEVIHQVGEAIDTGSVIAVIGKDNSDLYIRSFLPTTAKGLVVEGNSVNIHIDALQITRYRPIKGTVFSISNMVPRDDLPLSPLDIDRNSLICIIKLSENSKNTLQKYNKLHAGITGNITIFSERKRLFSILLEKFSKVSS